MCRDGDLIPCSMTIALLAYPPRIVAFLVLKWCPRSRLWSQCRGWVGWALNFFKNSTWEAKPGTMPLIWCGKEARFPFAFRSLSVRLWPPLARTPLWCFLNTLLTT